MVVADRGDDVVPDLVGDLEVVPGVGTEVEERAVDEVVVVLADGAGADGLSRLAVDVAPVHLPVGRRLADQRVRPGRELASLDTRAIDTGLCDSSGHGTRTVLERHRLRKREAVGSLDRHRPVAVGRDAAPVVLRADGECHLVVGDCRRGDDRGERRCLAGDEVDSEVRGERFELAAVVGVDEDAEGEPRLGNGLGDHPEAAAGCLPEHEDDLIAGREQPIADGDPDGVFHRWARGSYSASSRASPSVSTRQ